MNVYDVKQTNQATNLSVDQLVISWMLNDIQQRVWRRFTKGETENPLPTKSLSVVLGAHWLYKKEATQRRYPVRTTAIDFVTFDGSLLIGFHGQPFYLTVLLSFSVFECFTFQRVIFPYFSTFYLHIVLYCILCCTVSANKDSYIKGPPLFATSAMVACYSDRKNCRGRILYCMLTHWQTWCHGSLFLTVQITWGGFLFTPETCLTCHRVILQYLFITGCAVAQALC